MLLLFDEEVVVVVEEVVVVVWVVVTEVAEHVVALDVDVVVLLLLLDVVDACCESWIGVGLLWNGIRFIRELFSDLLLDFPLNPPEDERPVSFLHLKAQVGPTFQCSLFIYFFGYFYIFFNLRLV